MVLASVDGEHSPEIWFRKFCKRLLHLVGIQRERSLDKARDRGSNWNPVLLFFVLLHFALRSAALGTVFVFFVGCGHPGKKWREFVRDHPDSLAIRDNLDVKAVRAAFLESAKRNLCASDAS